MNNMLLFKEPNYTTAHYRQSNNRAVV